MALLTPLRARGRPAACQRTARTPCWRPTPARTLRVGPAARSGRAHGRVAGRAVPGGRRRRARLRAGRRRRLRARRALAGQRPRPRAAASGRTPAAYGRASLADRLWYPIWDAGVKLDHSVRTVPEARRVAADDLRALLGLLDLRHIAGDRALVAAAPGPVARRLAGRRSAPAARAAGELAERAERPGDLAFLLEPDLKESRGGLRDLVVLRAVAASWVADCPHGGRRGVRPAARRPRRPASPPAARPTGWSSRSRTSSPSSSVCSTPMRCSARSRASAGPWRTPPT